jgi:hypothetical protein
MSTAATKVIIGVDPKDSSVLWSRSLGTDAGMVFCTTPLWDAANQILVFSGAYGYGAAALRIVEYAQQFKVETLWHDYRLQSLFSNLLLVKDTVYLSRGFDGPAFLTAVNIRTGGTKWSTREFGKASFLRADGKLIILDENGWLALGRPKDDGSIHILSKTRPLSATSWTIPTLAGARLYLRDRTKIMALNLAKQ